MCSECFRQHDTQSFFNNDAYTTAKTPRPSHILSRYRWTADDCPFHRLLQGGMAFSFSENPGIGFSCLTRGRLKQWMNCDFDLTWTFSGRLGICMVYTAPWGFWCFWFIKDGRSGIDRSRLRLTTATTRCTRGWFIRQASKRVSGRMESDFCFFGHPAWIRRRERQCCDTHFRGTCIRTDLGLGRCALLILHSVWQ